MEDARVFCFTQVLTSSNELQALLDGKSDPTGAHVLAPADYHVHGTDAYQELRLSSPSRYGTRVHIHDAPLRVGHCSDLSNLTFHLSPDSPSLFLLDHSSRASIRDNFLNAPTAWDGQENIADFEPHGYGILTTDDSISEDNWNVQIYGNEFRWFKAGIETRVPGVSPVGNRVKGTSRWLIRNNGFDGCAVGIHALRPELFKIEYNHFQLHACGISIEGGHTNWIEDNDFERGYGDYDIAYDGATCYTLAVGNTAPLTRISKDVKNTKRHNTYARYVRKLNIWAPCDKGEID